MKIKNQLSVLIPISLTIALLIFILSFSYMTSAPTTLAPTTLAPTTSVPTTSPNLKVAFIGDQGLGKNSVAVLELIKDEEASMVIHSGDFDYSNDPDDWDDQINDVLGYDFPYFASIGNHDVKEWYEYQKKLYERLDEIPGANCAGDLGVKSNCYYQGLFFILSGAGTMDSNHDEYIEDILSQDDSVWRICSWHKNMNKMQVGNSLDDTGWQVYEECRKGGAMIVTGHEHSYSRTKTLDSFEKQIIDPDWSEPNNLKLSYGTSFVVVSGLGGNSPIGSQDRCIHGCYGEWGSMYTHEQGASFGALFCSFNVDGQSNKASCYFKDIYGNVPDNFTVTSFL